MARESCGTATAPLILIRCKLFYSETCRERLVFGVLFWVCFCDCRCWLKDNDRAWLAHYFTTLTILAALVSFGLVMLYFVFRQIRSREEWRQNRVAFLSMWGLSCLFGTTWVLAFLSFGPLTEFFMFLFCILNSFQGLHMLNAISPSSSVFLSAATVIRRVHGAPWVIRRGLFLLLAWRLGGYIWLCCIVSAWEWDNGRLIRAVFRWRLSQSCFLSCVLVQAQKQSPTFLLLQDPRSLACEISFFFFF